MKKASLLARLGAAAFLALAPIKADFSRGLENIVENAEARIIHVGGGSGYYPTLQSAINAAAPSDTVLIPDGTIGWSPNPLYRDTFPITIDGQTQAHGGNLTIMSEHGRDHTTLQNWNDSGLVMEIRNVGSNSTIQGFSVDGQWSPSSSTGAHLGLQIWGTSSPIIKNCSFYGTEVTNFYTRDSSAPLIQNCDIIVGTSFGRGVEIGFNSSPAIIENHFMTSPTALSSFIATQDTIAYIAIGEDANPIVQGDTYDQPGGGGALLVDSIPWRAILNYSPHNISAITEIITPYQTTIDALRTSGTPEQQAAYNCPAITDVHDVSGIGLVNLFGFRTSVPSVQPHYTSSSWGRLKTEYKK